MSSPTSGSSFDIPELFRERPYVYVLDPEYYDNTCHYCLKSVQNEAALLSCFNCHFAHYCDGNCQRAAWSDHRGECALLQKKLGGRIPTTYARLIAQMWLKREQPFAVDERLPMELRERRLSDVPSHIDYILSDAKKMRAFDKRLWIELQEYVGGALKKDEALDMYAKLIVHSLEVRRSVGFCGRALYVGASTLTPSCDPDTFAVTDGVDLVVRAAKPGVNLENPTQLTSDYLSYSGRILMTTSERRAHLAKYGIQCNCDHCLDIDRDAEMRSIYCQRCTESVPVADDPQKTMAKCPKCGFLNDVADAVEVMKAVEAWLKKFTVDDLVETKARQPAQFDQKMNEVLNLYYERAHMLLSPLNAYAARLTNYVSLVASEEEGRRLVHHSFPTYQRFGGSFHVECAALSSVVGQDYVDTGNYTKVKEGLQAAKIFKLHGRRLGERRCRMLAAEAQELIS